MNDNLKRIEEIDEELEKLRKLLEEIDAQHLTYEGYCKATRLINIKIRRLDRELRMIIPYTLSEIKPKSGKIYSLAEFIGYVKCGGFIDDDGFGRYVKDNQQTDIMIFPSDVGYKCLRKEFDTIIWFNR